LCYNIGCEFYYKGVVLKYQTIEEIEIIKKKAIAKINREYKENKIDFILNQLELAKYEHLKTLYFTFIKKTVTQDFSHVNHVNISREEQKKLIKQIIKSDDQFENSIRWAKSLTKLKIECDFIKGLFSIISNEDIDFFKKIYFSEDEIFSVELLFDRAKNSYVVDTLMEVVSVADVFKQLNLIENFEFTIKKMKGLYINDTYHSDLLQMNKINKF
jgi:hypothetical protein